MLISQKADLTKQALSIYINQIMSAHRVMRFPALIHAPKNRMIRRHTNMH
jgi:hypothetical protein